MSSGNDGPVTQTNIAQTNAGGDDRQYPTAAGHQCCRCRCAPASSPVGSVRRGARSRWAAPRWWRLAGRSSISPLRSSPPAVRVVVQVGCCSSIADGGIAGVRKTPNRPGRTRHARFWRESRWAPPPEGRAAVIPPRRPRRTAPVSPEAIAALAAPKPAVEAAKRARAQEQLKQPQKPRRTTTARPRSHTRDSRRSAPPTRASSFSSSS